MATTGLEVIDRSLHTTHVWLDEIMEALGPDRQFAWHVLGSVLRCLRDRMTPELAAHLGAQLPLVVRGAYYDRYQPSKMPEKIRSLDEFLEKLADDLSWTRPVDVRDAFRAVCRVLDKHIEPNQADKVWEALPEEIRRVAKPN